MVVISVSVAGRFSPENTKLIAPKRALSGLIIVEL